MEHVDQNYLDVVVGDHKVVYRSNVVVGEDSTYVDVEGGNKDPVYTCAEIL
jgi:hypothetical protein